MDLRELKKCIQENTIPTGLMILKYSDNTFIANQYIKEIAKKKNKTINYVDSIQSIISNMNSFFGIDESLLNIYQVETLDEIITDFNLKNTIVVCKSISSNQSSEIDKYVIEIPKLQNWMIDSYAESRVTGLNKNELSWLCNICKYDINRIDNELDKISIFSKGDQRKIFNQINEDNGYIDLNPLQIFDFTNAFIKKDIKMIESILEDIENIDVEPAGMLTILAKNFKNIISVQLNPKATAESLNVTPKQFNGIKWSCGKYTNTQLINIYELLTSIDGMLKSGKLPYENIVEYLTIKILG